MSTHARIKLLTLGEGERWRKVETALRKALLILRAGDKVRYGRTASRVRWIVDSSRVKGGNYVSGPRAVVINIVKFLEEDDQFAEARLACALARLATMARCEDLGLISNAAALERVRSICDAEELRCARRLARTLVQN